jgi:hypothetical protein
VRIARYFLVSKEKLIKNREFKTLSTAFGMARDDEFVVKVMKEKVETTPAVDETTGIQEVPIVS